MLISTDSAVSSLIAANAPVAFSVSGGKDSGALVLAANAYLDQVGHDRAQRLLIHADLGRIEWKESIEVCQALARHVDLPLVVVRRQAGDMVDRWKSRWEASRERYRNLEICGLIGPWSSASLRFCTSELKAVPISTELVRRFRGRQIISAVGIRREESAKRSTTPVSKDDPRLRRSNTSGISWNPLVDWKLADVRAIHQKEGFPLHRAYTDFGSSRLSCTYCILASGGDLAASASNPDNAAVYRELVELECDSTFSFQPDRWLGDVNERLLDSALSDRLAVAKERAGRRRAAESRIPEGLRYEKGWPLRLPSIDEAECLAGIRRTVADLVGLEIGYTTANGVISRFEELMGERARGLGSPDMAKQMALSF